MYWSAMWQIPLKRKMLDKKKCEDESILSSAIREKPIDDRLTVSAAPTTKFALS